MAENFKYAISFAEEAPMTAPLPFSGDIYENLRLAANLGYEGLEFHTRENASLDIGKIKEVSDECGVKIITLVTGRLYTQGNLSLLNDDSSIAQAAEEGLYTYINLAANFGADLVIGWVKGPIPQDGDREYYRKKIAGQIKRISEYAKEKGVRLLFEVINRYEVNLFVTAEESCAFFEEYNLDNCFVHLDTFHMNIDEADSCAAIRRCGSRLGYFHVADNTRRYPGSGHIDFTRILATLKEVGYSGYITVECIPEPDRITAAKNAIEHLRACEKNLGEEIL